MSAPALTLADVGRLADDLVNAGGMTHERASLVTIIVACLARLEELGIERADLFAELLG